MRTENTKFNISEIFFSIQGEGTRAGMPCVFIRLQGCNLRCDWCDTPYALESNEDAEWILETHLSIRLQLQIHKFIWEPNKRGV